MSLRSVTKKIRLATSSLHTVEQLTFVLVALAIVTGAVSAASNQDFFLNYYVIEDGFIEWMTFLGLLLCALVCFGRLCSLRKQRPPLFLCTTALLGMIFLFGAGEELSWGQRIFGIDSPDFFKHNNTQRETNIHNLVVGGIKLNKLVFSKGLVVLGTLYGFVITPLYRKKRTAAATIDSLAIPIPRTHHVLGYIVAALLVETLVGSPKRDEITEFAMAFIMLMNITYPYNKIIFTPNKSETADKK